MNAFQELIAIDTGGWAPLNLDKSGWLRTTSDSKPYETATGELVKELFRLADYEDEVFTGRADRSYRPVVWANQDLSAVVVQASLSTVAVPFLFDAEQRSSLMGSWIRYTSNVEARTSNGIRTLRIQIPWKGPQFRGTEVVADPDQLEAAPLPPSTETSGAPLWTATVARWARGMEKRFTVSWKDIHVFIDHVVFDVQLRPGQATSSPFEVYLPVLRLAPPRPGLLIRSHANLAGDAVEALMRALVGAPLSPAGRGQVFPRLHWIEISATPPCYEVIWDGLCLVGFEKSPPSTGALLFNAPRYSECLWYGVKPVEGLQDVFGPAFGERRTFRPSKITKEQDAELKDPIPTMLASYPPTASVHRTYLAWIDRLPLGVDHIIPLRQFAATQGRLVDVVFRIDRDLGRGTTHPPKTVYAIVPVLCDVGAQQEDRTGQVGQGSTTDRFRAASRWQM